MADKTKRLEPRRFCVGIRNDWMVLEGDYEALARDYDALARELDEARNVVEAAREVNEHASDCEATDWRGIGRYGPCDCFLAGLTKALAALDAAGDEQ